MEQHKALARARRALETPVTGAAGEIFAADMSAPASRPDGSAIRAGGLLAFLPDSARLPDLGQDRRQIAEERSSLPLVHLDRKPADTMPAYAPAACTWTGRSSTGRAAGSSRVGQLGNAGHAAALSAVTGQGVGGLLISRRRCTTPGREEDAP